MNIKPTGVTIGLSLLAAALSLSSLGAVRSDATAAAPKGTQTIVLAGGCFWGMEGVFEQLKGVSAAVSGYSGGSRSTAHYEIVSTGLTGHAESVEVSYDPSKITLDQLLKVFFTVAHDPTQLNRQDPDSGSQYRSAIFYTTQAQKKAAQAMIADLERTKTFRDPIVTQVVALTAFYPAEGYHQHFMARNPSYPYIVAYDKPKLEQLRRKFPELVKAP